MQIEGYIEFENSIPVTASCLSREFPIIVAGHNGILATPIMFRGFNGAEKLGPLHAPEIGELTFKDHFDWGSVYTWPNGDSKILACKLLFPNIPEESYENIGNEILLDLEKWRERLIDNISYDLKMDYRGTMRSKTSTSFGLGKFALYNTKSGLNKNFIPRDEESPNISIYVGEQFGLDETGFKQILESTSKGIKPELPFYFFLDAERSYFDGDYRKSVLDSATAAEICFSLIIEKLLPEDNALNKHIHEKHNSLKLKRELLKILNIRLPENEQEYSKKLDKIRNRVIHGGYIPTKEEAYNVLMITQKTLYTLLPFEKNT